MSRLKHKSKGTQKYFVSWSSQKLRCPAFRSLFYASLNPSFTRRLFKKTCCNAFNFLLCILDVTNILDLNLRKKLVKFYVCNIAFYGAERRTLRKPDHKYVWSSEMWCWEGSFGLIMREMKKPYKQSRVTEISYKQ